ncbi:hypothetical protein SASPL_114487 [Salvia splendens]|uniref:Uncharacterized protein n=1 Tax=Salvia splendens TaxID=180675 RepID=A0A8X8Y1Z9_SALSN|nr:hypothetical protein SASPL_114487 [Salvia splendens]
MLKKPGLVYISTFAVIVAYTWSAVLKSAAAAGEAMDEDGTENRVNNKENLLKDLENWLAEMLKLAGLSKFGVSGAPKFDLSNADFRWGKARRLELLSIDEEKYSMSLCNSSDSEGCLVVGTSLPQQRQRRRCTAVKSTAATDSSRVRPFNDELGVSGVVARGWRIKERERTTTNSGSSCCVAGIGGGGAVFCRRQPAKERERKREKMSDSAAADGCGAAKSGCRQETERWQQRLPKEDGRISSGGTLTGGSCCSNGSIGAADDEQYRRARQRR